jgi:hypothetical protein
MRKLTCLLVLLLMSLLLLGASASAHALTLPLPAQAPPFAAPGDGEEEADDELEADDESDEEEADVCESENEEAEARCEEELLEAEEAEECVLEDASASFTAAPGAGAVRLRVHYRAFKPTLVSVDARLRGAKGNMHLGGDRVRFRRAGVYSFSFELGTKQMAKAVAAKDFEVDLQAAGTAADCALHLATRAHRRAR